jgi:hypothetical protein
MAKPHFAHRKATFKLLQSPTFNLLIEKCCHRKSRDILFNVESHSLQNGLFSFDFRTYGQIKTETTNTEEHQTILIMLNASKLVDKQLS